MLISAFKFRTPKLIISLMPCAGGTQVNCLVVCGASVPCRGHCTSTWCSEQGKVVYMTGLPRVNMEAFPRHCYYQRRDAPKV